MYWPQLLKYLCLLFEAREAESSEKISEKKVLTLLEMGLEEVLLL